MVSFKIGKYDANLVRQIVERAMRISDEEGLKLKPLEVSMDITATHVNGCPLDLQRLLAADDFNFVHDVLGIRRHIDRRAGVLTDCFVPRFAARSPTS